MILYFCFRIMMVMMMCVCVLVYVCVCVRERERQTDRQTERVKEWERHWESRQKVGDSERKTDKERRMNPCFISGKEIDFKVVAKNMVNKLTYI